ncbi:hypothetical protein SAMN05444000_1781, partial [Shimia gijangensis]
GRSLRHVHTARMLELLLRGRVCIRLKARSFSASAVTRENLYSSVRNAVPFIIVVPTLEKSGMLRISGVIDSVRNDDTWRVNIKISNDIKRFGMPKSHFPAPTLVAGSPEAEEKLALVKAEAETDLVSQAQAEIDETLAKLRTAGEEQVSMEGAKNAAELLEVIAEHSEKRGKLIAEQTAQISELETGFAIRRQQVLRQIKQAEELKALQAKLATLSSEIAANEIAAVNALEKGRVHRSKLVGQLPKKWNGTVRCVNDANSSQTVSYAMGFGLDGVNASGFTAKFWLRSKKETNFSGSASILSETISFPLDVRIAVGGTERYGLWRVPTGFTLQMTADGRLSGKEKMDIRWNRSVQASMSLPI